MLFWRASYSFFWLLDFAAYWAIKSGILLHHLWRNDAKCEDHATPVRIESELRSFGFGLCVVCGRWLFSLLWNVFARWLREGNKILNSENNQTFLALHSFARSKKKCLGNMFRSVPVQSFASNVSKPSMNEWKNEWMKKTSSHASYSIFDEWQSCHVFWFNCILGCVSYASETHNPMSCYGLCLWQIGIFDDVCLNLILYCAFGFRIGGEQFKVLKAMHSKWDIIDGFRVDYSICVREFHCDLHLCMCKSIMFHSNQRCCFEESLLTVS